MKFSQELASKRLPNPTKEQCGLILQSGEIIELENTFPKPEEGFRIDPKDVVRYYRDAQATWHTHLGPALLSGLDYAMFQNWPNLLHYIVGSDGVKCYKVEKKAIFEVVE